MFTEFNATVRISPSPWAFPEAFPEAFRRVVDQAWHFKE